MKFPITIKYWDDGEEDSLVFQDPEEMLSYVLDGMFYEYRLTVTDADGRIEKYCWDEEEEGS